MVEYDAEAYCCICRRYGAWLINGDYYCEYCAEEIEDEEDEDIDIFGADWGDNDSLA